MKYNYEIGIRNTKGKKCHFYKHGKSLKKYYCKDCKKEIFDYRKQRC